MNREDLQLLSDLRLREAQLLHRAGEYSGAYYLAGYAVECGLKACFARSVREHDFPDRDRAPRVFTHKLRELVKLARLEAELSAAQEANPEIFFWLECRLRMDRRKSLLSLERRPVRCHP
jgi:HEPN domain-containing protein